MNGSLSLHNKLLLTYLLTLCEIAIAASSELCRLVAKITAALH